MILIYNNLKWDTAGQERFRTITTSYYRGAQAIVIVYDVTDKDSFDHVRNWMLDVDKFAKEGVLKFLVGNKCDLQHKRQVTTDQGKELAKQYGIQFFLETSAKDTVNIDSLFEGVTRTFLDKSNITNKRESTKKEKNLKNNKAISIDNLSENTKKKKGCC